MDWKFPEHLEGWENSLRRKVNNLRAITAEALVLALTVPFWKALAKRALSKEEIKSTNWDEIFSAIEQMKQAGKQVVVFTDLEDTIAPKWSDKDAYLSFFKQFKDKLWEGTPVIVTSNASPLLIKSLNQKGMPIVLASKPFGGVMAKKWLLRWDEKMPENLKIIVIGDKISTDCGFAKILKWVGFDVKCFLVDWPFRGWAGSTWAGLLVFA